MNVDIRFHGSKHFEAHSRHGLIPEAGGAQRIIRVGSRRHFHLWEGIGKCPVF